MSSRRFDSRCSSDQSSGIGVIAKNAFWPLSSGPGDDSIAPPNARRKTGVQRISSGSSARPMTIALAAEGLDPGVLRTAEVEEVVGRGCSRGDGIEDAADERRLVVGSAARPAHHAGHSSRGEPDHLGADGLVFALGAGQDPLRGEFVGAHRVAHLRGEKLGAETALAVARGQDDVAKVGLEARDRVTGRGSAAA